MARLVGFLAADVHELVVPHRRGGLARGRVGDLGQQDGGGFWGRGRRRCRGAGGRALSSYEDGRGDGRREGGRYPDGDQAIAAFVKERVNVDHIYRDRKVSTGVALIFVDKHGENSIGVAPGANGRLSPADLKKARKIFTGAGVMVVQLEIPLETVQSAAVLAAKSGARVILNPAPARALPDELLRHVSILTPNETEAELLTGIKVDSDSAAAKAASILRARGVQTVILTLGARGALVATSDSAQIVPGFKVTAVDTTGAGDVFNGALAVALAEGQPLIDAVRFANAAAALSVTRLGAQPSCPSRREIQKLLKSV